MIHPAFYLSAIIKSVLLGQQAGATGARSAGRMLVGSTLAGAGMGIKKLLFRKKDDKSKIVE